MTQKNNILNFTGLLLLIVSVGYLTLLLIQNRYLFIKSFNADKSKLEYEKSQWRVPNSKNPISDETLYTYSGYRYINGENPILINPEAPPFGKYLIGLSILCCNNGRLVNVLLAYSSLILLFIIVYYRTSSLFSSSLVIFLTSINSLFTDQLIHNPQLEIQQVFFLLLFILFFMMNEKKRTSGLIILTGISLGFFLSIKAFSYHIVFVLVMFFVYSLMSKITINRKSLFKNGLYFIWIIVIALITFTATYFRYFLLGGTIRGFFGVQKWIFLFYKSSGIDMSKIIGSYLTLIFINRWRFWTNDYPLIPYHDWNIIWPIVYLLACFAVSKLLKNKTNLILISLFITYNLFLMFTPIYPRYLLLLYVLGNLSICIHFDAIINSGRHNEKNKK